MRVIKSEEITEAVAELSMEACCHLGKDVLQKIKDSQRTEKSSLGVDILKQIEENALIAAKDEVAICQDCGLAVVFAEIGQDVHIDGDFETAVNEGVIQGYAAGYLRKSTCDPLTRANYGNNAPAILHTRLVSGDRIKLTVAPKGGGSENMSAVAMFPPAAGRQGIIDFVVDTVRKAGPNPCPPMVIGVGIGGNFEKAPLLAKEALLAEIDVKNEDPIYGEMEAELLARINRIGIGPGGLGGSTTALAVHIKAMPCHIASLPCAVNINCHAARHKMRIL